jgi:hypothetical protein
VPDSSVSDDGPLHLGDLNADGLDAVATETSRLGAAAAVTHVIDVSDPAAMATLAEAVFTV